MSSTHFPERVRPRFFELTGEEWLVLVVGAVFTVSACAAIGANVTLWVALGLGFTAMVIGHLCMTARRFVAFPDLVVAAACLQWIVAPWLAEMFPPNLPVFRMSLPPDQYLQYAVSATVALWIGLHLPVSRRLSKDWAVPETQPLTPYVRYTLDLVIVLGLIVDRFESFFPVEWIFLAYLVSSFRFIGALGWMVTQTPGWKIRVAVVLIHLAAVQSTGGLFYLVVHWGGFFLLVYAFMKQWRWQMAAALLVGVLGLSLLQTVKPTFRTSLVEQQVSGPVEAFTRLISMMYERVSRGEIVDPQADMGDTLVRFNQGWIVARVMTYVPSQEPYARGSTVTDAAVFSIIPRFLFPSKRQGASQELFYRFTGVNLSIDTRMGLGIIGEMYANFGPWGGVAATFLYGSLMGWLFLLFADRARRNPLWWAASSTVLLPGVEPGFNLEDIANHVVKAGIVFIVLWKTIPALQQLMALPPDEDQGADSEDDEVEGAGDAGDVDALDEPIPHHGARS
jgi:hypothetical protein